MAQSKKYSCRVSQNDTGWTAEIVRRASAKKSIVTKKQDGFASETEAQAWGETEVSSFLKKLNENESSKRRAKKAEQELKAAQAKKDL